MVNFTHPANRKLIAYVESQNDPGHQRELDPATVDAPYYKLSTHPEIVERLWEELGGRLPMPCRWILYGRPVLVASIQRRRLRLRRRNPDLCVEAAAG